MDTKTDTREFIRRTRSGSPFPTQFLFGVRVDNVSREQALESVLSFASHRSDPPRARSVFFTNVHSIHLARSNSQFRRVINYADLVLPDGSGLALAARSFGSPILENLNGTDFTPCVLQDASRRRLSVYLLGARAEVNSACRIRIASEYAGLRVVGSHHGHFSADEEEGIVEDINLRSPDILLVGLGSPRQELWISQYASRLNVGVCVAVGGLFDFITGRYPRAPVWFRQSGLEWLFRFVVDPIGKWQRVLIEIPLFLLMVGTRRILPDRIRALIVVRRRQQ